MTIKILILLTTIATAKSCDDMASFQTPQPVGVKDLTVIPSKIHGRYVSLKDSVGLRVNGQSIIQDKFLNLAVTRKEFDKAMESIIRNDTTFYDENNMPVTFKFVGDSVRAMLHSLDTLFFISDDGLIRKYGRNYFLNSRISNQRWEVSKLVLEQNEISLSYAWDVDIDALRKQLKTSDSTKIFNPTKSQFRQFVKDGGFRSQQKFKKQ